jgi:hypothetical protein
LASEGSFFSILVSLIVGDSTVGFLSLHDLARVVQQKSRDRICSASGTHFIATAMEVVDQRTGSVSDNEIEWMLIHRSLDFNVDRCLRDYPRFGKKMIECIFVISSLLINF